MAETDEHAASLAGGIYGTVIVAGVLAASSGNEDPSAGDAAAYALATVLVFWLVESWARDLGRRAAGAPRTGGFLASLRGGWPLAQSALAPLSALALARLLGASHETAISIGVWVCVGLLTTWGATIAIRERASIGRIVGTGAGCGLLGLLMIGLKALVN